MRAVIPDVLSLEVHSDLGHIGTHWDAVLVADYPSEVALTEYQAHPDHVATLAWLDPLVADRAVVDFDVY